MNSTFVAGFVVSFVLNVVTTGLVIGIALRMSETIKALGFVQNDVVRCRQFISISEQRLGTIEHQEETLLELLKQIVDTDEAFKRCRFDQEGDIARVLLDSGLLSRDERLNP